jgi:transposase
MLYKPENVVDLDTGAIVSAEVRKADEADTAGLAERAVSAAALVEAIREDTKTQGQKPVPAATATLTADKGYFCVAELEAIQQAGLRTVISDPVRNRRLDKLDDGGRAAVRGAHRATRSGYGKGLLRRRGMHIERSFAHILDSGGMRRATLRGQNNPDKRYKVAAATYNLSQLMRHLLGIGTPKQAAAWAEKAPGMLILMLAALLTLLVRSLEAARRNLCHSARRFYRAPRVRITPEENRIFSTGC